MIRYSGPKHCSVYTTIVSQTIDHAYHGGDRQEIAYEPDCRRLLNVNYIANADVLLYQIHTKG